MRILMKGNYTADWIPDYLQPATQNALRAEMQKARASSDVEGYIYTFEILGMGPILSTKLLISSNPLRAQIRLTRRRYT
jgi:hypothetical protein